MNTDDNVRTLRKLRSDAGLSLSELADRMGGTVMQVSKWERWHGDGSPESARDPRKMRLDSAARLSNALGVSLDDLWDAVQHADSTTQDQ